MKETGGSYWHETWKLVTGEQVEDRILITQSFPKNPEWVLLWLDNCIPNKHKVIKNYLSFFQWKLSNLGSRMCVYFQARTSSLKKALKLAVKLKSLGKLTDIYIYIYTYTHTHTPLYLAFIQKIHLFSSTEMVIISTSCHLYHPMLLSVK